MQQPLRSRRRLLVLFTAGALMIALGMMALGGSASARSSPAAKKSHAKAPASTKSPGSGRVSISSLPWGTVNGAAVNLYTLKNANGMKVRITNYGGVVQSIWVPDHAGKLVNVALGFPTLADYVNDFTQGATSTPWPLSGGSGNTYFGAIIGRYANRIANASFSLNGTTYKLDANNGTNTLHGGYLGWNTDVWTPSASVHADSAVLKLTAVLPAGEGCLATLSPGCTGFPAAVSATVTYTLDNHNQLNIDYSATNDDSSLGTVINLTNHTYFNLGGEASGDVYGQLLALNSSKYTPVNTNLIPEAPYFVPVGGTAYDFRSMHPIGKYIRDAGLPDGTGSGFPCSATSTPPCPQLVIAHGYDNNWVLNGYNGTTSRLVAVAQDVSTGITLWTYTDQPGVQVYTGNFLVGDLVGTSGHIYRQGAAFTLETQHYPDSPHHIGDRAWPTVVLNPGATFKTTTAYKFGIEGRNYKNQVSFS